MYRKERKRPEFYTQEDHELLKQLFVKYGNPNDTYRYRNWDQVCEEFNLYTSTGRRSVNQIQGYFRNRKSLFVNLSSPTLSTASVRHRKPTEQKTKQVKTVQVQVAKKKTRNGRQIIFTEKVKQVLEQHLHMHGSPSDGYGNKMDFFRKVCNTYNTTSTGAAVRLTAKQVANYVSNKKRDKRRNDKKKKVSRIDRILSHEDSLRQPLTEEYSSDIVCRNIRSLGTSDAASTSSGNMSSGEESNIGEYRSLADEMQRSWGYPDLGTGAYSLNPTNITEREPFTFEEVGDVLPDHPPERNGMTSDLAQVLMEQTKQHHRMKMRLLKEEYNKMCDLHKTKVWLLEKDLEMKKKRHEKKMEILHEEYRRLKDGGSN